MNTIKEFDFTKKLTELDLDLERALVEKEVKNRDETPIFDFEI